MRSRAADRVGLRRPPTSRASRTTTATGVSVNTTPTKTVLTALNGFNGPAGAAVSPNGARAYVTNFAGTTVSVIDTATNTVVGAPITVGTNPNAVAVSPD